MKVWLVANTIYLQGYLIALIVYDGQVCLIFGFDLVCQRHLSALYLKLKLHFYYEHVEGYYY